MILYKDAADYWENRKPRASGDDPVSQRALRLLGA